MKTNVNIRFDVALIHRFKGVAPESIVAQMLFRSFNELDKLLFSNVSACFYESMICGGDVPATKHPTIIGKARGESWLNFYTICATYLKTAEPLFVEDSIITMQILLTDETVKQAHPQSYKFSSITVTRFENGIPSSLKDGLRIGFL